jgi:hypothetical protein
MSTALGARSERAVRWTPQASQKCRVGDPGRSFLLKDLGEPFVNWKLFASTAMKRLPAPPEIIWHVWQ